jgi:hypothetical protein
VLGVLVDLEADRAVLVLGGLLGAFPLGENLGSEQKPGRQDRPSECA